MNAQPSQIPEQDAKREKEGAGLFPYTESQPQTSNHLSEDHFLRTYDKHTRPSIREEPRGRWLAAGPAGRQADSGDLQRAELSEARLEPCSDAAEARTWERPKRDGLGNSELPVIQVRLQPDPTNSPRPNTCLKAEIGWPGTDV